MHSFMTLSLYPTSGNMSFLEKSTYKLMLNLEKRQNNMKDWQKRGFSYRSFLTLGWPRGAFSPPHVCERITCFKKKIRRGQGCSLLIVYSQGQWASLPSHKSPVTLISDSFTCLLLLWLKSNQLKNMCWTLILCQDLSYLLWTKMSQMWSLFLNVLQQQRRNITSV